PAPEYRNPFKVWRLDPGASSQPGLSCSLMGFVVSDANILLIGRASGVSWRPPWRGQMSAMTRREFLKSTAKQAAVAGLVSAGPARALELRANPLGLPIGCQTWPLTQMLVPSLDGPKKPTMDDVKRAADEYNKMGELAAMSGIQQGLHNETFETSTVDDKRTYDVLLDLLDPKLVQFQFQVSTIAEG